MIPGVFDLTSFKKVSKIAKFNTQEIWSKIKGETHMKKSGEWAGELVFKIMYAMVD